MMPARIEMDFVRRRRSSPVIGLLLIAIGVAAASWTYADLRDTSTAADLAELALARYERRQPDAGETVVVVDTAEVDDATRQLSMPWSELLQDLESAAADSSDNIALLEVAPDKTKASVRVAGEARSLPHVLEYLERLQAAGSLVSPLLESHEVQVADRDRPVHFVILADWMIRE